MTSEREQQAETPAIPEPPRITIPEKKGLFSKIKGIFSKKEEVEELEEHHEKFGIEILPREPVEEVVVEEPEVTVEGAPLKKVDIHREEQLERERAAVEGLFESAPEGTAPEPAVELPKRRARSVPVVEPVPEEEFSPTKVSERIKGVKVKEETSVDERKSNLPGTAKSGDEVPEKKGFFQRIRETITHKKLTADQFEQLFWDLEVALLENNVAVEVIDKIKQDLKLALVDQPIPRGKVESTILASLRRSLQDLFDVPSIDLLHEVRSKKPFVICFVGINGSGKTTTIAKVTHLLKAHNFGVVLAAADTFRAAAIDQLQLHADKLGVKLVKHDYGADPAAVAFDAIKHAEASKKDVVLIDTAGRLHSNINLVDEMKKIVRVAKPDLTLFIGESITGNDCVEQAKQFNEAVGIDGIILSKADIDEKGGAAISVSYVTKKPILYLGTGQEYDDLKRFDAKTLLDSLGL
ncbi:signal recognition particle-docking protein FtsY [Candidatus Woesearchaeota archaeon]|nr:signal recognition particle-docking protein FtsY [Candidatus Woesearchaeota archaeon]